MNIKRTLSDNRILAAAILFSLACHLFWLSFVNVVIGPGRSKGVKFSRVSFLGPILDSAAMQVSIGSREMLFLEKRYRDSIEKSGILFYRDGADLNAKVKYKKPALKKDYSEMALKIDEAVAGTKVVPGNI